MSPLFKKSICIILIASLYGCQYTGKLTRRYKKLELKPDGNIEKWVGVEGYVYEPDKPVMADPVPKIITDLSPEAQRELIRQISNKERKSDSLIFFLGKDLYKAVQQQTAPKIIDYSVFKKRFVLTLKNLSDYPADRISKVEITLQTLDANVEVVSFDKLVTNYQTTDIGKVNYNNSMGFDANAGIGGSFSNSSSLSDKTTSGSTNSTTNTGSESNSFSTSIKDDALSSTNTTTTGYQSSNASGSTLGSEILNTAGSIRTLTPSANVKFSAARSLAEEVLLKQRYVVNSGSITDKTFSIYQESVSGIDLTGTIITDVKLKYNHNKADQGIYNFKGLFKADNSVNDPSAVGVANYIITYPNNTAPVYFKVKYTAYLRHVRSGDKTISESDDKILLYHGYCDSSGKVLVVPPKQFIPKLWTIRTAEGTLLSISSLSEANPGNILFIDFDSAKDVLLWLKKSITTIRGKQEIKLKDGIFSLLLMRGRNKVQFTDDLINSLIIIPREPQ